MAARRTPKIERLVVNAIRRLQDAQGSTCREITNYISQEYDVTGPAIKKQVNLALRRGVSYGILQQRKGGYYTYNQDLTNKQPMEEDRLAECVGRGRRRARRRSRGKCKSRSRRRAHRSKCKKRSSRSRRSSRRKCSRSHRRKRCSSKGRRKSSRRRRSRGRGRGRKCRGMDMDSLEKNPKMEGELSGHANRSAASSVSGSSDERQLDEPIQETQTADHLENCED